MKRKFANKLKIEGFKGYVCKTILENVKPFIVNIDGDEYSTCGNNYTYIKIYPDNENYCITVIYDDKNNLVQYYFDAAYKLGRENGIPYEDDLYLELVIRPNKKYYVLDKEESEEAYNNEITEEDKVLAYTTIDRLINMYALNYGYLEEFISKIKY